uniref:Uncharacterized protein n=1 Tax=Aegilops tauschii subsp. strangulata TaxID=200361 RepID=A0A453CV47_AEGTS
MTRSSLIPMSCENLPLACQNWLCHHRAQRNACLAVEKLWKGENKLPMIFRMVTAARLSRIENQATFQGMNDRSNDAATAAVDTHADADGCSDDDVKPDTGEAAASTSKKGVQKQKSKKKSKKSKGRGKK